MKKLSKLLLALVLSLGLSLGQLSTAFAATSSLEDGNYQVTVSLKNAANIANDSMANGAINHTGTLHVNEGVWSLDLTFTTLTNMGLNGNVTSIKTYSNGLNTDLLDVETLSTRIVDGEELIETVNIPMETNSSGRYVNIVVDVMAQMGMASTDAYVAFDIGDALTSRLNALISEANQVEELTCSVASYATMQTALATANSALTGDDTAKQDAIVSLSDALDQLVKVYQIEDGRYSVDYSVLNTSGNPSMAASALTDVTLIAKDNVITVSIDMQSLSGTWVEGLAYNSGTEFVPAVATYDEDGHAVAFTFDLPENVEQITIQFTYTIPTGAVHNQQAILALDLENLQARSIFEQDGTYTVNLGLWNATSNLASMANAAIQPQATIVVSQGVARLYLTTQEMSFGTMTAWLEELYIGSSDSDYHSNPAKVESTNSDGKATMWSFVLPSEAQFIDVIVNPHVAMMGNVDIPARLNIDYSTLLFVSDSTASPVVSNESNGGLNPGNSNETNESTQTPASPVTGDETNGLLFGGLVIVSLMVGLGLKKRQLCK